jgi:hypothetical protein
MANLGYSLTQMQPEQVQEAERRARSWLQDHAAATAANGLVAVTDGA